MGHYLACRYYGVDASLPYFIPAPLLTGTLGAFIRIRQPIPDKRQLFDIGIAGPLRVSWSPCRCCFSASAVARGAYPDDGRLLELGEPLLLQGATRLLWGTPPTGYTINLHPTAFAAWFGCLATVLNLFPSGQLDGGHISYAVFGTPQHLCHLRDHGGTRRVVLRCVVLDRLGGDERRDAVFLRPEPPANL
jgi:membrane-associated protease RseP (regulator of RpoE activity)